MCRTLSIDAKCEELHSKKTEAQKSEAKIQDLQLQLNNLIAEQKCKNHKDIIADLSAKLKAHESMSPKTLNSGWTKKHVHFLEEMTCCDDSGMICSEEGCATAPESVLLSVLKVMQHCNSAESCTTTHGQKEALESDENPQTTLGQR